jgi:hypothetical protein
MSKGVAAANFAMESKSLLNIAGAICTSYSVLYAVYRKEGTRIPSVNTGTCRLLDDQNRGSAVNVRN